MMGFDLRSLYTTFTLYLFVSVLVMIVIWLQTRKRLHGVLYFVLSIFFIFIGDGLILLRGDIPDFLSIMIANVSVVLGAIMTYIGVEKFNHFKSSYIKHIIILVGFTIVHYYFYAIHPDIAKREINISIAIGIVSGLGTWLVFVKSRHIHEPILKAFGITNLLFALLSFIRVIDLTFFSHVSHNYFKPDSFEIVSILSIFGLCLFLLFFLILMINQRLVSEIKLQDDKFHKAFYYAPFSMIITRMSDGMIYEVNKHFERTQGLKAADFIGKTTKDLHIWLSEEDRLAFIKSFKKGYSKNTQYNLRQKNNEIFVGEISAQTFLLNNEDYIISVIIDVTEKKKADDLIKNSQKMLKNFATQLQIAVEDEKVILANQIDNELNQSLVALKMDIGLLKNRLKGDEANSEQIELSKKIEEVYSVIGVSLGYSLKLMNKLRNEVLHVVGFMEALEFYINEFTIKNHIECSFETNISKLRLNQDQSTPLFKVFENAMTNIVEHAMAKEVIIRLNAIDTLLKLEIVDNGVGFEFKQSMLHSSKNLMFMQERIHLLDGKLKIDSSKGHGTKITIEIPVSKESYITS